MSFTVSFFCFFPQVDPTSSSSSLLVYLLFSPRSGFISIKKKEKQKKDEGMKTQSSSGYRRVSDECDLRRLDGGADEGVADMTTCLLPSFSIFFCFPSDSFPLDLLLLSALDIFCHSLNPVAF